MKIDNIRLDGLDRPLLLGMIRDLIGDGTGDDDMRLVSCSPHVAVALASAADQELEARRGERMATVHAGTIDVDFVDADPVDELLKAHNWFSIHTPSLAFGTETARLALVYDRYLFALSEGLIMAHAVSSQTREILTGRSAVPTSEIRAALKSTRRRYRRIFKRLGPLP